MPDLKLAKLPDRRPVKLVIQVLPDLDAALADYAAAYEAAYGTKESVIDLIPSMLENFLESDRSFMRNRRR
ncbi:DUF2274 domain-containing protein [Sphingopyxis sp. NJF-3]